ncbi:MAG: methyltransferase domain-containing protein, partial [Candidatus Bathyarchaeia archaeon]
MENEYIPYIREMFARLAPFYDISNLLIASARKTAVELANAKTAAKVLDVATGTGKQAFAFARKGYDVVGVDLSRDMLKVAKKNNKHENAQLAIADARDMPFANSLFDVACVSFALHDVPLAAKKKVLKEMARVAKPNGVIVVVDYASPETRTLKCMLNRFARFYESKYYPEYAKLDLKAL